MKLLVDCPESTCINYRITAIPAPILEFLYTEVTSANTGPFYSFIEEKSNIQYTIWNIVNETFYIFTNEFEKDEVKFYLLSVSYLNTVKQFQASQLNTQPTNVVYRQNDIYFVGQYFEVKQEFLVKTPYYDPYQIKYFLLDGFFGYGEGFLDFEYDKKVYHFTKTATGHYGIHSIHDIDNGSEMAKNLIKVAFNGEIIINFLDENPIRVLSRVFNKLLNSTWLLAYPRNGLVQISGFRSGPSWILNQIDKISNIVKQNKNQASLPHAISNNETPFKNLRRVQKIKTDLEDQSGQLIAVLGNNKALVTLSDLYDSLNPLKTIIVDYKNEFDVENYVRYPYILDLIMEA